MTWCVGQYVALMFQDWLPGELGGSAVCVTGHLLTPFKISNRACFCSSEIVSDGQTTP